MFKWHMWREPQREIENPRCALTNLNEPSKVIEASKKEPLKEIVLNPNTPYLTAPEPEGKRTGQMLYQIGTSPAHVP
jgi:hypothetical protein